MKHYAAMFEEFTPELERAVMTLFFNQLSKYFKNKKNITIDQKNKKIWQRNKLFFNFDKKTRLFETERVDELKAVLATAIKSDFNQKIFSDFLKQLKFSSSATEAYMLSQNGQLFSETPRIHQNNNKKTILFYEGVVNAEFGLRELLTQNSGLLFGHGHADLSSYNTLREMLPMLQQQGLKAIYLELPYDTFSSLLNHFNKNKDPDLSPILAELKKNKLYKNDNDIYKRLIENLRKLLISAKKVSINIYACDMHSINFTDQTLKELNIKHRLKVGDACMIRSIEKLQYDQKHPKFLALIGVAHVKNIAQALGVPSCFVGEKKQYQIYQSYMSGIDYLCFSENKALYSSGTATRSFLTLGAQVLEQKKDPKIKQIINYWDKLIQELPTTFLNIPTSEVKKAREVYIEYVLEKAVYQEAIISTICTTTQPLVVEYLTKAIYAKNSELVHPKNWPCLFRCTRPYGIRLAENETNTFSISHLNILKSVPAAITKPHNA